MKKNKTKTTTASEGSRIALFFGILALAALTGFFLLRSGSSSKTTPDSLPPVGADGVQEVRMNVNGLDYEPSVLPVRAGQKVRWVIDASNAEGCARTMYSKALGINQMLNQKETIIEFTAPSAGTIPFSCTMGMSRGEFQVV